MAQVQAQDNPNYRKVTTGSQLGTPQLQALLIKTYNEDWGTLTADPLNPNIKIGGPDTIFSRIVSAVQSYAEIYFIGNPQVGAGGESEVTECVIWINANTHTGGVELTSTGRWTAMEQHIQSSIPTNDIAQVYYAVPEGWVWRVDGSVPPEGSVYFPSIQSL
jgi:hypothetical protein